MESDKRVPVPSRIRPSVLEKLKRIAEKDRRTLSGIIQLALEEFAEKNDPDTKSRKR